MMHNYIKNFEGTKVLVIGDVMIDRYINGAVHRMSPEAPVPVVDVADEQVVPGGAANVAVNIAALGGVPYVVGVVGDDAEGAVLQQLMQTEASALVVDSSRRTTQKVRVMNEGEHVVRYDIEDVHAAPGGVEQQIMEYVSEHIGEVAVVVVSDYAKGVVKKSLMQALLEVCAAHTVQIIVDPKPGNKELYRGVSYITPNYSEALAMTDSPVGENTDAEVEGMAEELSGELECAVLVTRSEKGMTLFHDGAVEHTATCARSVRDIVGAGDTVVAALALALAGGAESIDAMNIANHAAGVAVGKQGTASISARKLQESLGSD